jgi:hypothetical protein
MPMMCARSAPSARQMAISCAPRSTESLMALLPGPQRKRALEGPFDGDPSILEIDGPDGKP